MSSSIAAAYTIRQAIATKIILHRIRHRNLLNLDQQRANCITCTTDRYGYIPMYFIIIITVVIISYVDTLEIQLLTYVRLEFFRLYTNNRISYTRVLMMRIEIHGWCIFVWSSVKFVWIARVQIS